jgi:dihydroneopterin aldolase
MKSEMVLGGDTILSFIHDCHVDLPIGIHPAELEQAQPVIVNVECEARLTRRYDDLTEKAVAGVINYEPIYNFIRHTLPGLGHIYFLESAAEQIASFCLRDERVQTVRVRLEKTAVFPDAAGAGVELQRTRT